MKISNLKKKVYNKFWWIIGTFFRDYRNRMILGDNHNINNWLTFGDIVLYNNPPLNINIECPPIIAHSFWHGKIETKQLFSIKSFLCTQKLDYFEIWLWLDQKSYDSAKKNHELQELNNLCGHKIKIKKWNIYDEITNTPFEKIKWYFIWERPLPSLADDFRIITLYKYGGLYFDLDVMFCKDFTSLLLRDEFTYAWEKQPFANSALIYLRMGSYLSKQIAQIMIKRKSSQPWAIFKYSNKRLSSLKVYPCYLFDPLWTGYLKGMPLHTFEDFFRKFDSNYKKLDSINSYKDFFPGIFTYHWHNMWEKEIHEDSYFGLFNKEFDSLLLQKFPT